MTADSCKRQGRFHPDERGRSAPTAGILASHPLTEEASDESRLVVSEPLRDLKGAWNEVPEAHYGVVQAGQDELRPFVPQVPL
jgi:hypothetical protein